MKARILVIEGNTSADRRVYSNDFGMTPAESATHMLLRERLSEALTRLPERERRIIQLRYGIGTNDGPQTLEQVGREFGITRERTRQIEAEALRKLRHPGIARGLRSFLE